jgi:hypothetical protein
MFVNRMGRGEGDGRFGVGFDGWGWWSGRVVVWVESGEGGLRILKS